jgi:hypothetical protein
VRAETPEQDAILAVAQNAEAVFVTYAQITADVIAGLENCKVIGRFGVGTDNNDLGEPHVTEGAGLSVPDLDASRGQITPTGDGEITMMGVDVGRVLHVVIRTFIRSTGESRLEFARTVRSFEELPELMTRFNVRWCVIDSQPELHMVTKFIATRPTRILAADYSRTERGHVRDKHQRVLHLNRTQLFDALFESFRAGLHRLPEDARSLGGATRDGIGEYYREMLALQRVVERDNRGDLTARYEDANRPDHFAHAEAYCYSMFVVRYGRRSRLPAFAQDPATRY